MSVKKFGGLMPYGDKHATALAAKVGGISDIAHGTADAAAIAMVLVDKKDLGGRRVVRLNG